MNRYRIYTTDGDYEVVESEKEFTQFLIDFNEVSYVTNTGGCDIAFILDNITKVVDVTDEP